jgi:hypothetical protein
LKRNEVRFVFQADVLYGMSPRFVEVRCIFSRRGGLVVLLPHPPSIDTFDGAKSRILNRAEKPRLVSTLSITRGFRPGSRMG